MPRHLLAVATLCALLAACGEKAVDKPVDPSTGPQSEAEVKQEAHKVQLKPGQWEGHFTVDKLDIAGLPQGAPPQMAEQMKQAMNRAIRYCVTPEQAANPDGKMFSGQQSKDCTYSGFDASGGAIKGQVSCKGQGGTMTAVMAGRYALESYDMTMDMKNMGGPQGSAMTIKARTSGKWIGPTCS